MESSQQIELSKIIGACWESQSRQISPAAIDLIVQDLSEFDYDAVVKAIHIVRKKGLIVNAGTVIPLLEKRDGRPPVELAWSMVLESMDESKSVMMTDEMIFARGSAEASFSIGDKVAARMAFKESYDMACDKNRADGLPVKTFLSTGFDKNTIIPAIQKAADIGMIAQEKASLMISNQSPSENLLLSHDKPIEKARGLSHVGELLKLISKNDK